MERFAIKIDKKLKANLYKICRLCGMDNPEMVPIIPDEVRDNKNATVDVEAEMEMKQKISLLLGLSITKDDRMPQTMCCLCVDKINDFYEFREMCYATHAQTRKLLGLKNIKKPALDIKPKVEVKEVSIVPTLLSTPASVTNKNVNRKRKVEELPLKEETLEAAVVTSKKKLRISIQAEANIKEETPVQTKKKLRFSAMTEDTLSSVACTSKKSKFNTVDDTKLKKEPSPPVPVPLPAVSNKKLRLAALPLKEFATKKSKQKGGKTAELKEVDVKEEIKEEIKEEPTTAAAPTPLAKVPSASKLKFGCNICKERFHSKVNLETHTRTIHIPKVERYVCTACNEILSKSFDIKNHQLWHKLSKTPYICGCCGESILNTYAFSRHLREHAFETPPALQVLDRECPQCHTSYATNFLYNIHICAVKTRRCAGCNRLQRNDTEYLKHSALCAKAYLNYSKHIMPSVEALEDAVRIKNENDVEAAAEEMARISGVPLDMAPVVQLTRLSSPVIMAASHCVSTTGLDDSVNTSSKKSGKKGVSKKDLKRVDELLKSTLDALVSIKHEPEVHVDPETPCAGDHSDNDDNNGRNDHVGGFDDLHHNNDSNSGNEANSSSNVVNTAETGFTTESGLEQIKIKQEIDETNEDNSNKIGGGLKLKIKKEHGQLNSSIIEQQKSSEKRAEKRKKKKKHKEKEKDKQKLSKDVHDEQLSQDFGANNNSVANVETTTVRIKAEPQDGTEALEMSAAPVLQTRPQPEATIMTSIPMMQFQIACVSSGVEFNNGTNTVLETENHEDEPEDVKPNRQELDRILKISHVTSGVAMETDEPEANEAEKMDHIDSYDKGNSRYEDQGDFHEESNEDDQHDDENVSEHEECNQSEHEEGNQSENNKNEHGADEAKVENVEGKSSKGTGIDNNPNVDKKIKKPLLHSKSKLTFKEMPLSAATKSRNKACKSTAKPPNIPILQISAVQSGVTLEATAPHTSDFTPIFIKPEPLNRGYSDELPADSVPTSLPEPEQAGSQGGTDEFSTTHSPEEENYISSIDFNNITIKQEKDIEINDVQITQKSIKSFAKVNGIKRKRKQVIRSHSVTDKKLDQDEKIENNNDNMEDEEDQETDDEEDDENYDEEVEEEQDEDEECEEEEDEEMDDEEEEREYRELEYPPQLVEKNNEVGTKADNTETNDEDNVNSSVKDTEKESAGNISFFIASVCSQANSGVSDLSHDNVDHSEILANTIGNISTTVNVCEASDFSKTQVPLTDPSTTLPLSSITDKAETLNSPEDNAEISSYIANKENTYTKLSSASGSSNNCDISVVSSAEILQTDLHTTVASFESPTVNTHSEPQTSPVVETLHANETALKIGLPFEITADDQITDALNFRGQSHVSDSTLLLSQGTSYSEEGVHSQVQENSEQLFKPETQSLQLVDHIPQEIQSMQQQKQAQNTSQGVELNKEDSRRECQENLQDVLPYSITHTQNDQESKLDCFYQQQDQQQENLLNTVEHYQEMQSNSPDIEKSEVKPHTSKELQPAFDISSVRTRAPNVTPELNIYPLSNTDDDQISEDNQGETATIEGIVQQPKDVYLEAKPVIENIDNESVINDGNDADDNGCEDENEDGDDDDGDGESTLGNNLEERQNYQNQAVLSQIRPTALALHPYLEDISSSSNSLLSNSLSQTPPPPSVQSATSSTIVDEFKIQMQEEHRLLNSEETENILNESNDILSRRSLEVPETSMASVSQLLTQPNIGQLLPPHMPTFNFDNINEIAENNNNANIEREQLQDEQQQYQQNQYPTTSNP